jgi:hypothetical protein
LRCSASSLCTHWASDVGCSQPFRYPGRSTGDKGQPQTAAAQQPHSQPHPQRHPLEALRALPRDTRELQSLLFGQAGVLMLLEGPSHAGKSYALGRMLEGRRRVMWVGMRGVEVWDLDDRLNEAAQLDSKPPASCVRSAPAHSRCVMRA